MTLSIEPRSVPLGGLRGLQVDRTLPTKGLPTIGPWCFLDQFGPTYQAMDVLPHPHIGLQTVTWLLSGVVEHRDNLGSHITIEPGQLNLMTAGDGVSHSEFSLDHAGAMHGIQLWVALPEDRRHQEATFEHYADLPVVQGDGWKATVFMGEFRQKRSPASAYSPMVGTQIHLNAGSHEIKLNPAFEHGVLAVDIPVEVSGDMLERRALRFIPTGADSLHIETPISSTIILIGGEPWQEPLIMWWNFVARTHGEIVQARNDWESGSERFGRVEGHGDQLIPAPPLPPVILKPRVRRLP